MTPNLYSTPRTHLLRNSSSNDDVDVDSDGSDGKIEEQDRNIL